MPIDRERLDEQLRALGGSTRWWDQRELRDLPGVLDAGEQVLAITRGKVARLRWLRRSWLIVVTSRRLLCLRSSGHGAWRQLEVKADEIGRVGLRIGPFRGRVAVVTGGHTYRLLVPRTDAFGMRSALAGLGAAAEKPARLAAVGMIRRMVDHVLALPVAALGPDPAPVVTPRPAPAMNDRLQAVEREAAQLRQQVVFLEQLLRERHAESGVAAAPLSAARAPGQLPPASVRAGSSAADG